MSFSLVVGTNTYVTRAEADAFLAQSFAHAALWESLDGPSRDRSLVEAFRLIERQRYKGTRTGGSSQAAQFPRDGIASCDGYDRSGTVPAEVKQAQMVLAALVAADSSIATSDGAASNVKRAQAGSASVEFFRAGTGTGSGAKGARFPAPVQELLRCYLLAGGGAGVGAATSAGTDGDYECPDFGLTEGFS